MQSGECRSLCELLGEIYGATRSDLGGGIERRGLGLLFRSGSWGILRIVLGYNDGRYGLWVGDHVRV